ncbi:hypothetical protein JK214_15915 [Lactiplantibacillus plantarum]|nr:hypothetical protein [Lactiplantibacillus plantarum]MBS0946064.1 hypothetical protein [Lactiplantibacillus plantarum]
MSLASELIGTSDFYALFTGKDIDTGQKRSRGLLRVK